ncbi:MAG: glycosyltransferase [Cyanobacteria bacterium]|jgi:cellulose synthase/poly-beta-1,6-N-acetylglucosamine synthase-like glycosyltransferase|nr:glycosyltransferase [Cyanobacteria bacterium GSL.Bin1]
METLIYSVTIAEEFFLSIPIFVLFVECLSAALPVHGKIKINNSIKFDEDDIAILIPAHNEELSIKTTVNELLKAVKNPKTIISIADNCNDNTALIAQQMGITVLERNSSEERGKGYALDYGLAYLAASPPSVVIVLDADCILSPQHLKILAKEATEKQRPIQAVYLMEQPSSSTPRDAISGFAFMVKNWVRPKGLNYWQLPCLLTGTGMAFPWSVLQGISLASGNIVEDMKLGIDLAIAGYPPLLAPEAKVIGRLPSTNNAATTQRTRWEHGHLQTILEQVPRLIKESLKQQRIDLLALALELAIPPLSLLVLLWLGMTVIGIVSSVYLDKWWGLTVQLMSGGLLFLSIFIAWYKFGRKQVSLKTLLTIPLYLLWKVPLYFLFLIRPQKKWVKTERDINLNQ